MGSVLVLEAPRQLTIEEEPEASLAPHQVRLRTLYSGISAGTDLSWYRGTNPRLHKRWDKDRRLFIQADSPEFSYPRRGWSYEEVGEVVEVGAQASGVAVGQRVYGMWGQRTHHSVSDEYARTRVLPPGVDPILGVFARIGEITFNAILDAQINLGETVAVFGLGVIGQVVAQLAKLSGARVIATDLFPRRLEMAKALGADEVLDAGQGSVAEKIKDLTGGRGADVCIESSGVTSALGEAIRACAYSSRVVVMGFFHGEAKGLHLGEEYHHNRIDLVCSQISGVTPALRHRWDSTRLLQTFVSLTAAGRLNLKPLVTHVAPLNEAAALFEVLDKRPEEALQAVISFNGEGK